MQQDKVEIQQNIYFPLIALNYSNDITHTAGELLRYGIYSLGKHMNDKLLLKEYDYDNCDEMAEKYNITDYDCMRDKHTQIMVAIRILGIIPRNIAQVVKSYKRVNDYIMKYPNQPLVKMKKDLLIDVRDGKFSERDFRILAALYSIIGDKTFVRITTETVRVRLQGFKSMEMFQENILPFKDLTARQIQTTIEKLQYRKFFDRVTYRNRLTFYSRQFHGNALLNLISESLSKKKAQKDAKAIMRNRLDKMTNDKAAKINENEFPPDMRLLDNG